MPTIKQGLLEIQQEIEADRFTYKIELEDIHLHIERALIERIGDTGRKLHTGRSRNDQVSTDLRLWCRWAIDKIDALLLEVQRRLLVFALAINTQLSQVTRICNVHSPC